LKAMRGEWVSVMEHGERLLDLLCVPAVVETVVRAAFELRDDVRVVRWLRAHAVVFGEDPPAHLLQWYVRSLTELGETAEALAVLGRHEMADRMEHMWLEIHVLQAQGNTPMVVAETERLLEECDRAGVALHVQRALNLAQVLAPSSLGLAQRLWRKLAAQAVPSEVIPAMVHLGFRICVPEAEIQPWLFRMIELAKDGSTEGRLVDLEEFLATGEERAMAMSQLAHVYAQGEVGVHLLPRVESIAAHCGITLAVNEASPEPLTQAPALLRHGGQRFDAALPQSRIVHLDVTAALVAHHFDILESVEAVFDEIWISPKLVPLLHGHVLPNLTHNQPERLAPMRQVLRAVDEGRLIATPDEPSQELPYETMLRRALNSLVLSGAERDRLLKELGLAVSTTAADDGASVSWVMTGAVASALAGAGVLDEVLRQVHAPRIGSRAAGLLRREVADGEAREQAVKELSVLMERLRLGIRTEKYQLLSPSTHRVEEAHADPRAGCLLDLLDAKRDDVVVWVDDRWVAGMGPRWGAAVVSTATMVRILFERGALTEAEFYRKLLRLRRANVWFVPPLSGELSYHLRQAPTEPAGHLGETAELRDLRRSCNAALTRHATFLRKPPQSGPFRPGDDEGAFLLESRSAVEVAMVDCWRREPPERARLQSAWLCAHLYLTYGQVMSAVDWPRMTIAPADLMVESLLSLLVAGMTMLSQDAATGFFTWLADHKLHAWLRADGRLARQVAASLAAALVADVVEAAEDLRERVAFAYRARAGWLPEPVRELVAQELARAEVFRGVGIRSVELHGISFELNALYMAACEAVNQRSTTVEDRSGRQLAIHPLEPGRLGFWSPDFGVARFEWEHVSLAGLLEPAARCGAAMEVLWKSCDFPRDQRPQVEAQIFDASDAVERVDRVNAWLATAVDAFFDELAEQLHTTGAFRPDELLPLELHGVLRHLRLEDGDSLSVGRSLSEAARLLLDEEGLHVACLRFAALPVPLDPSLVEAFECAPVETQRPILEALRRDFRSPVALVHRLRLVSHTRETSDTLAVSVDELMEEMNSARWVAFNAVLRWVYQDVTCRDAIIGARPDVVLSVTWLCAHRVFCSFGPELRVAEQLAGAFDSILAQQADLSDLTQRDLRSDVAHPQAINPVMFEVAGLAHALDGVALSVDQRSALDERTHQALQDGSRSWRFELWCDHTLATDALGSFLSGDYGQKLERLLREASGAGTLGATLQRELVEAFGLLGGASTWHAGWVGTYMMAGTFPVPAALAADLSQTVMSLNLIDCVETDPEHGVAALYWLALQAAHHRKEEVLIVLRKRMLSLADWAAGRFKELDEEGAFTVAHGLLATAMVAGPIGELAARIRAAGELAVEIAERWPATRVIVRGIVQTSLDDLPPHLTTGLAASLVRLRALC